MYHRRPMVSGVSESIWSALIVFIILTLQTISSVADLIPADKNDPSLCFQYHRVIATQLVSYIEEYQEYDDYEPFIKHRQNFRTENVTKWETVETCCPQYEPHQHAEDAEKCVPVCHSGCSHGECIRPNECSCNQGYQMSINVSTGFSECLPYCWSGCHGGSCIEPEVCSCDAGYILALDKNSCEASCINVGGDNLQGCGVNALCIAPDTCKCDEGYAGFTIGTAIANQPHQFLELRPNEITAKPLAKSTFNTSDVVCKPLCEPECGQTASCTAPNKCQCNAGYVVASSSKEPIGCLPVCEQTCINSFCSSPNVCTCHEGYKPHQLVGLTFCEPICRDDCINAKCTSVNHCECTAGYEKLVVGTGRNQIVSGNICVPVCHGNCPNGRCVAPGQCHCNPGYVIVRLLANETASIASVGNTNSNPINLMSHEFCQPFCEPGCPSGSRCIAPNQCQTQHEHDKNYNRYPSNRTRVLNNTEDCGKGDFSIKNGRSVCLYDLNGTRCSEPSLCAIIFIDETEMSKNLKSLQRIIFFNNGTKKSSSNITNSEIDGEINSWSRLCTDECRILISSEGISENYYTEVVNCYEFELLNVTTGLLLPPKVLPNPYGRNETLLCFVKAVLTSNTTESEMIDDAAGSKAGGVASGIVGTVISLVLIVGIGVSIYLVRRKFERNKRSTAALAFIDTVMERSGVLSINTEES